MNALTVSERGRLLEHERTIEKGLKSFIAVGEALIAIRDGRLYREKYGTFDEYCKRRWAMTQQHGLRLVQAAEVIENLKSEPIGSLLPATESQARPLTRLEPAEQVEAWKEVVESAPNGKVTAAHVEKVVKQRQEPAPVSPAVAPSMAVHYSSKSVEWETPQELFDLLDEEFSFTLDVCALPENAKCKRYFTPDDDGLAQSWAGNICWMNPPYGTEIADWVAKAHREAKAPGTKVVCLLPARTDTGWWWDYCIVGQVRFIRGRLKFGGGEHSAPFPSALVIFQTFKMPTVEWWRVWKGVQLQEAA